MWNTGTGGYGSYELLDEWFDCVLCREGDVSVRGTNRAIGLGVDEAENLEAGLAEMASGNHRTGEGIVGRTVPRGIGCQLGEQAEERG